MIFPLSSDSTQASSPDPVANPPAQAPEPARYRVFHIQHSPGTHKIFIPTSSPRPAGYLYHVLESSNPEDPQPTMTLVSDIIETLGQVGTIHDSRCVGSIASQELDNACATIKSHPRPIDPYEPTNAPGRPGRCELWILSVIDTLLGDGLLQPPPSEPTSRAHQPPRHHHTAHCTHQRLYSYHPYQRRSRPALDRE
ncbi:hypothetical protein FOXG_18612 [Fusarium oxysporum f. sp. lycopersici 4287]|uniref:Uncharacterized protein n=2 Tax=Fusarium oxysporum TaxID=5507 RepID=A0A0J9UKE4_FUSO4|nr:hypothetical protein FOXG_18612 [Fusarium oxysporum f. sp. lycopersici 4287]XP_018237945.1 hypothetical protein FOXG_18612 [Fusarium oxysporum f. sp. lycopersici 4287]EXK31436.1 hypothetical protein FOMG_13117 [Fusarium oxysporum f. sp. melonis 26406]KAJ9420262.1 hypothetical protein QL093DRAFT_1383426 [Fusarium oxysporum]EXK31437.1 hypothetical protein FOMG_13117 [Fusarium oxysporum f. sp. melonis 26406]KNA99898.1 hypothetical protein FOXG_18612 [Fusarium oxysporum f. sp. lycopersici 4287]